MKIKVSEATGPVLNWLVAKAQGAELIPSGEYAGLICWPSPVFGPETRWSVAPPPYTTSWASGGPIIEDEDIYYEPLGAEFLAHKDGTDVEAIGPTPLIAAMRCFCCSKLGDIVDIPEELCQQQRG